MNNKEFYARCGALSGRLNAYAALVQCNWETRSGGRPWSSELFVEANNGAGLKAWSGWQGPVYEKVSWESEGGRRVERVSRFCKYGSVDEFLANYADKLSACYPLVSARRDNFWGAEDGLISGQFKWATDPIYAEHLFRGNVELAKEIFGGMWRNKLLNALEYAMGRKYMTPAHTDLALRILREATVADKTPVRGSEVRQDAGGIAIAVDFGHGGHDSGACGGGLRESALTRIYGEALGRELTRRGYDVHYTRVGDEYVGLRERAERANGLGVKLFLSIHFNSVDGTDKPRGMEVWLANSAGATSHTFARYLVSEWGKALPAAAPIRGIKKRDLTVLAYTRMPAALVEIAFISNAEDRRCVQDAKWRECAVSAIANAVDRTFEG